MRMNSGGMELVSEKSEQHLEKTGFEKVREPSFTMRQAPGEK
jgi:hypothetical protein